MKSFGKTFRAILALSLALCMVMSCVTVSADEVPTVALELIQVDTTPDSEGYYAVTAAVSEAANGGSATILAYTGTEINNNSIGYANQDLVNEQGQKTFEMELKKGTYTVLAGATGFAAAKSVELVVNGSAPAFEAGAALAVKSDLNDKTALANTVVVEEAAFPIATDADKEAVTYSIGGTYADKFDVVYNETTEKYSIVLKEALAAGTYDFTLVATSVEGETPATLSGALTVASTVETVSLGKDKIEKSYDIGNGETEPAKPEVTEYITLDEGTATIVWGDGATVDNVTTYTATITLPQGYEFSEGVNTAAVTYVVTKTDSRKAIPVPTWDAISVQYNGTMPALPTEGEGYTVTGWKAEGTEFDGSIEGTYKYVATATAADGYKFNDDTTEASVSIDVVVADSRTEVEVVCAKEVSVDWAKEYKDPEISYTVAGETVELEATVVWSGESVNTTDDRKTYTRTATVKLPAEYRIAGTHNDETTVEVTVKVNDNRKVVTVGEIVNPEDVSYGGTYTEPDIKLYVGEEELTDLAEGVIGDWTAVVVEFNATVAGTYTYNATIKLTEEYKFADNSTEKTVKYTVNVVDKRVVVTGIKVENNVIEVAANDTDSIEAELAKVTATYVADGDAPAIEFADAAEWTYPEEYEGKPGTYTVTKAIKALDDKEYNVNSDVADVIEATVTIGSYYRLVSGEATISEGAYVADGTKNYAVAAQNATLTISGGQFDGKHAKEGAEHSNAAVIAHEGATISITGGEFRIDGLNEGEEGHIDLIYSQGGTINISGGTFYAGEGIWPVNVLDGSNGSVTISGGTFVGADPLAYEPFDEGKVILAEDKMIVKEADSETWTVVDKAYAVDKYEFVNEDGTEVIDEIIVTTTTTWDEAVEEFPSYIKVYSGDKSEIIDISFADWKNHKEDDPQGFPPAEWTSEPFALDLESVELPAYWNWGTVTPAIKVTTQGEVSFAISVDGYDAGKKYISSVKGQPADVAIIVDEEKVSQYGFSVNGGEWTWGDEATLSVEDDGATKYVVEAAVKYLDGTDSPVQKVTINKYNTVFSGKVFINATEENATYSAARTNRQRPIDVSFTITNTNKADYEFNGTATLKVYKNPDLTASEDAIEATKVYEYTLTEADLAARKVTIAANDTNFADNASYRFVMTYAESGDDAAKYGEMFTARYTYISNNGTWYSDFTINGMSKSGIIIRKDENLVNEFTLTDIGADNEAYIGYSLIGYADTFNDIASENYVEYSEEEQHAFPVASYYENAGENASYKFYSMVKLDSPEQSYFDMNVSRTVYVYGSKTTISNLKFGKDGSQGATAGPVPEDGYITIAPYWYQEFSKDTYYQENPISYKLIFESGVDAEALKAEGAVVGGSVVEGEAAVTFADTKVGYEGESGIGSVQIKSDVFGKKVVAKLEVYVDGEAAPDRVVNKTFWPQAAK